MFGIPRRYSHFVFAVVQSGLTCLIAAGIASLPLMTISQFLTHWLLSGHLLADDAADRGAGNSCNSLCFASSDERRIARPRTCDYASQCCFAGALRDHRTILGRAVQKSVAGRILFTGRALERFVRIFAAEKFFYFRKRDGVAHDRIALHFFILTKQTMN
jgi:hypothetical protein